MCLTIMSTTGCVSMILFQSGEDFEGTYHREPRDPGEDRQWLQRRIHQRVPLYSRSFVSLIQM